MTSFLTTISCYQVHPQHLAGKANLPSDFTSRNAADCSEPNCQICNFVHKMEDSIVRNVSIHDILTNKSNLPFTTRSAWRQIQNDCPDLRRVHAHLKQGTRTSKQLLNVWDIKRYLSSFSIAGDGLLVVKHTQPFVPVAEAMVVPRSILDGLLTALHIKLENLDKNPVAEKAVRELEEELIRQEVGGRPVSAVGLALTTAHLNSRLRLPGL